MEPVSIIVPTYNSIRTIEACLLSARAQEGASVEVVVVDNHSTDGTYEVAASLADRAATWGPERSAQRNHGAAIASGSLLIFVDSDMVLDRDVARAAVERFAAPDGIAAAVIPELAFGVGFLARCRALEKQLYLGDPAVEAARVFRRAVFDELGGFDETLHGPEDYELTDRAAAAGHGIGRIDSFLWHDDGRIVLRQLFRKKRYYGRTLAPYIGQAHVPSSRRLARASLVSRPGALVRAPHLTAGLGVLKTVEAAGLLAGILDARRNRAQA